MFNVPTCIINSYTFEICFLKLPGLVNLKNLNGPPSLSGKISLKWLIEPVPFAASKALYTLLKVSNISKYGSDLYNFISFSLTVSGFPSSFSSTRLKNKCSNWREAAASK